MIDYILSFTDQPTAQADSVVGQYYSGGWDLSRTNPIVESWNPANDTTTPVTGPNGTVNVTTHSYTAGFWIMISLAARVAALDSHSATVVCLDRDGANAGELPAQYILGFKASLFPNIVTLLAALRFQPVFCGSHYPSLGIS